MKMNRSRMMGLTAAAFAGLLVATPGAIQWFHAPPARWHLTQNAILVRLYGSTAAERISSLGDSAANATWLSLWLFPVFLIAVITIRPRVESNQFVATLAKLSVLAFTYIAASQGPSWLFATFSNSSAAQHSTRAQIVCVSLLGLTAYSAVVMRLVAWPKRRIARLFLAIEAVAALALLGKMCGDSPLQWVLPNRAQAAALGASGMAAATAYLWLAAQIGTSIASASLQAVWLRRPRSASHFQQVTDGS